MLAAGSVNSTGHFMAGKLRRRVVYYSQVTCQAAAVAAAANCGSSSGGSINKGGAQTAIRHSNCLWRTCKAS